MELSEGGIRELRARVEADVRDLTQWMTQEVEKDPDSTVVAEIKQTCDSTAELLTALDELLGRFRASQLLRAPMRDEDILMLENLGFLVPETASVRSGVYPVVGGSPEQPSNKSPVQHSERGAFQPFQSPPPPSPSAQDAERPEKPSRPPPSRPPPLPSATVASSEDSPGSLRDTVESPTVRHAISDSHRNLIGSMTSTPKGAPDAALVGLPADSTTGVPIPESAEGVLGELQVAPATQVPHPQESGLVSSAQPVEAHSHDKPPRDPNSHRTLEDVAQSGGAAQVPSLRDKLADTQGLGFGASEAVVEGVGNSSARSEGSVDPSSRTMSQTTSPPPPMPSPALSARSQTTPNSFLGSPRNSAYTLLELQDKLAASDRKVLELNHALAMATEEARHMNVRVKKLEADLQDHHSSKQNSESDLTLLRERLRRAEAAAEEAEAKLKSQLRLSESERREREDKQLQLQKQNRNLTEELEDAEKRFEQLLKSKRELEDKVDQEQRSSKSFASEKSTLQEAVRDAQRAAESLKSRLEIVEQELQSAKEDISTKAKRISELEAQHSQSAEALNAQVTDLRQQLDKAQAQREKEVQEWKDKAEVQREEEVQELKNALSQQTRETEEVRQKLHAKEEELNTVLKNATQSDDVEKQAEKYKRLFKELQEEAEQMKTQLDKIPVLERQIAEYERIAEEKSEEMESLRDEFARDLDTFQKEQEKLKEQTVALAELEPELERACTELKAAQEERDEALRVKIKAQEAGKRLRRDYQALKEQLQQAQQTVEDLRSERETLLLKESTEREQFFEMVDEVTKKENRLLRSVIDQLKAEMLKRKKAYADELEQLRQQILTLQSQGMAGMGGPSTLLMEDVRGVEAALQRHEEHREVQHTYAATDDTDPLDVAVTRVLNDLKCPVRIHLEYQNRGEYMADRLLKLRLVDGEVMIRKKSGLEPLQEYLERLYAQFFQPNGNNSGNSQTFSAAPRHSPSSATVPPSSSKDEDLSGSQTSNSNSQLKRKSSSFMDPTSSSQRRVALQRLRQSRQQKQQEVTGKQQHDTSAQRAPSGAADVGLSPDSEARIRQLHRQALKRQFEDMGRNGR